ncbi:laminin subunit beta-2-like [Nothoprocta perdicaria]|uniref:laminin subunit beta-2-like n=1 Tax=Nothoprocta perdicaria TaxID=30464 RepID=UPI000E1BB1BB|nr:laminin subunit beta-2-like [Nothoprocta perdicaria]
MGGPGVRRGFAQDPRCAGPAWLPRGDRKDVFRQRRGQALIQRLRGPRARPRCSALSVSPGPRLPMDLLALALLLAGVTPAGGAEEPELSHGCAQGSCYPATGNLLVGRADRLSATSTCGLRAPQEYCIVSHLQDSEKCFTCDSREPSRRESHRIENVIYLSGPGGERTWWQSENGVEHVSIRLDLEGEFHFTHLIMKFKTFRPAAMLVERSADFGRTWRVYRYFAYNCSKLFPGVAGQPSGRLDEVLCDQRYSEIEPSSHGEVIFKVLDPSIPVEDPYSPAIQDLLRVTNLRVNLTKLHTLGDNLLDSRREIREKYYYALYELVLRGNCFCYGHASECAPLSGSAPDTEGMVHGRCVCKHHTQGLNCERCEDFYHDLPWPCRCDPRGTVAGSSPCDPISGDCYCKRFVAGRSCSQCVPEFWGLSYDVGGCRPCACDFGGAYSNRCSMEDGACPCRPHLMGRQCDQVEPGFFCAPLDYYTYEAEEATGHGPGHPQLPGAARPEAPPDCPQFYNGEPGGRKGRARHRRSPPRAPSRRGRQQPPKPDVEEVARDGAGRMVTWTGPGFARVRDGAGLTFRMDNVPYPMEYEILLRYEPESAEDWEAVVSVSSRALPTSPRCGNLLPSEQLYRESLPHTQRYVLLSRPFCFEPSTPYEVAVRLQRAGVAQRHPGAFILIDSLALLPRVPELPGLAGAGEAAARRRHELERYRCLEAFRMVPLPALAQACARLVCSVSALLHDGALPCQCDPQGSRSAPPCPPAPQRLGWPCHMSRPSADPVSPAACACSPEGSVSATCDAASGQCRCQPGAVGRQCDRCQPGHWGFPACRPCQCNGHAEECEPRTGSCLRCRDHTDGRHCERCQDGYYGDPVLGSGQQCRPCPCPGFPGTRLYHGSACHADRDTGHIVCLCAPGYDGPRCDRCSPGYFGAPEMEGGACRPCQCNNNIDSSDPGACDPRTGHCLRCLYHTAGPRCAECQPGYYGNALQRSCRRCGCDPRGTLASHCAAGACSCERASGACACRPNVLGKSCDRCAPHFWGLGAPGGCEPCGCHPTHALHPACDVVTGQCHCRPGFGGRDCSQCRENHWGDPALQCRACECEPLGAASPQCEPESGQCQCREGFGGPRCDRCQRGYQDAFPRCPPCHPCFGRWEPALGALRDGLQWLRAEARALREGGPAPSPQRLRALQDTLGRLGQLLARGDGPGSPLLRELGDRLDDARTELDDFWRRLQELEQHVEQLARRELAHNASRQLDEALGQLGAAAHKMQEVQELARGARSCAEEALGRSQAARTRTEKATAQLRDFIRRIKAFLAEEGADPGSIELVARQVLNISLPSSPGRIQELLQQIQESIAQLDGVDAVLNSTAQGLAAARSLLARGQEARERAEGVRDELAGTQRALRVAQAQAAAAGTALQSARDGIRAAESRAREAERRLQALQGKQQRAQERLRELAQRVAAVQQQSRDSRRLAQQAEGRAQLATAAAGTLSQDLVQVTQRYLLLKGRVSELHGVSPGARQRVLHITQQAQHLLDKANSSKRKLEELEQHFGANEQAMAAKATRLQALERRVSGLLQEIRERANAYATC